jgi:hypothetical protein
MKDDWVSKSWNCGCGAMNAGWLIICGRCLKYNYKPMHKPVSPCSSHDAESQRTIEEEINDFLYNKYDR